MSKKIRVKSHIRNGSLVRSHVRSVSDETKANILAGLHMKGTASFGSMKLQERRKLLQSLVAEGLLNSTTLTATPKGLEFVKKHLKHR